MRLHCVNQSYQCNQKGPTWGKEKQLDQSENSSGGGEMKRKIGRDGNKEKRREGGKDRAHTGLGDDPLLALKLEEQVSHENRR